MNTDLYEKATTLLEAKGLTLNERLMVRGAYAQTYKDDYPFIGIKYVKGEVKHYHSTIKEIEFLGFKTEQEVILANAIYENVKGDGFNVNEFIQMVTFTKRLLGTDNP